MRRERGGLIGPTPKQRDLFAFEQPQRAFRRRLGFGDECGARDEHGDEAATEPAHPEERHRDVEPLAGVDAARGEPRLRRAERAAVGVHDGLRGATAAGAEDHDHVVGRAHELLRRPRPARPPANGRAPDSPLPGPLGPRRALVPHENRSQPRERGHVQRRAVGFQRRRDRREVFEMVVSPRAANTDQMLDTGGAQLRRELGRSQERAERHQHRADAHHRDRGQCPLASVGHEKADTRALADAFAHKARGQLVTRFRSRSL